VSAQWRAAGSYGTIGLELVLCLMVGLFGGRWLDGKLGTDPWLSVVGFCFGLAAGAKAIHRGWKEMQEVTAREEREEGNPQPRYDPDDEKPDSDRRGQETPNGNHDAPPDDQPK
jgi:F0F1-type ATP synthase assembly protein I